MKAKRIEVKINIKNTPKEYVDNLALGLVHSGYEVYFDYEKENICFVGFNDELIGGEIEK